MKKIALFAALPAAALALSACGEDSAVEEQGLSLIHI